ncbi:uncharacterized protein LOC141913109 isoform X2 [Tubulanus polymorphus]|uniref:uncharacterized protein LOC141913109 isoform X2 n=1 Tax=Tubulanus polymorphus TaxID=672921 RepID=UPI003DA277E5
MESLRYAGLLRQKTVGDWCVVRCVGCTMTVYATHIQQPGNRVIVNIKLQRDDSKAVEQLRLSENFSHLFEIKLSADNDNQTEPMLGGLCRGRYEMLQPSINSVQKKLTDFLVDEEAAMEERIRKFEEVERNKFAALRSKARNEKSKLMNLMMATDENEEIESETATDDNTSSSLVHRLNKVSISSPDGSSNEYDWTARDSTKTRMKPLKPVKKSPNQSAHSPDTEDMFGMDGFDNETDDIQAYSESDDENDTDDSSMSTSSDTWNRNSRGMMYSMSLPVSVPSWSINKRSQQLDDIDDEPPQDIAASIKAIAQSIHEDGREIFGDLPRRKKFSTVDLVKR